MTSKEFLDYLKKISENEAIEIIDNMNLEANRMANLINKKDVDNEQKNIKNTQKN